MPTSLVFLLFIFLSFSLWSQPGSFDQSFGDNGIMSQNYSLPFPKDHRGFTVMEKPDGKILAAGSVGNEGLIVHLNPDGTVEPIGPNYYGFEQVEGALVFGGGSYNGMSGWFHLAWTTIYDLVLQEDGKIVCVGTVGVGSGNVLPKKYVIFRQEPDGGHDPTFGEDGFGLVLGSYYHPANAEVAIQPDGKILISSRIQYNLDYSGRLARHLPDGQPDSTFATNGYTSHGINSMSMLLQPDGKIVVGGMASFSFALARFNTDGTWDNGFGIAGITFADITEGPDWIHSMELQTDGKILAVGRGGDSLIVARFTDAGLDPTYAENGFAFIHLAGKRLVGTSSVLQPDGNLLVAGYAGHPDGETDDFLLARLTPEGILDETFGNGGIVLTDVSPKSDQLHAISLQEDGKIIVSGHTYKELQGSSQLVSEFVVARYLSGLETDVTESPGIESRISVYPNPAKDILNITFPQIISGQNPSLQITELSGKILKTYKLNHSIEKLEIPIYDQVNGVYLLQYLEERTVIGSERFVIQK